MVGGSRALLGQYAGFVTRAFALTIDVVIVSATAILLNWVVSLPLVFFFNFDLTLCAQDPQTLNLYTQVVCWAINWIWFIITIISAPIYFTLFVSIGGQTVGKYVMGVRVVRIDGQRMTVGISFFRWLGYFVSLIPFGLGFFMVAVDGQRRALHDRLAGTCVIYAWRARQDEFLLERIYRKFHRGEDNRATPALPKLSSAYDIVAIAVPNYNRMQVTLNGLESLVDRGDVVVVNTAILAKDNRGDLGVVGVSDFEVGKNELSMIDSMLNIPHATLRLIEDDMPSDSFIIIVLLKDEYVDMLTGQISRRSAAHVRVYDVGENPDTLTSTDGTALQEAALQRDPIH